MTKLSQCAKIWGTKPSEEAIRELDVLRDVMLTKLKDLAKKEEQPDAAPVLVDVLINLLQAGGLEYGLAWVPDLVRNLDIDPDEILEVFDYLYRRNYIDLFWPPGSYSEHKTFTLDSSVSDADRKLLRPGLAGGMIGYARIHNANPHRQSRSRANLYTWSQVVEAGRQKMGLGKFVKPSRWWDAANSKDPKLRALYATAKDKKSPEAARKARETLDANSFQVIHTYLDMGAPLIVSWGLGRDSTAVLVEFVRKGIVPDCICYAEVGCEKPETYAAKKRFEKYLAEHDFPRVQTIKYVEGGRGNRQHQYDTLEDECLSKTHPHLPGISYNYQSRNCSSKWKVDPQEDFIMGLPVVQEAFRRGLPYVQVIGFDNSAQDAGRSRKEVVDATKLKWYPLQEWKWDLEESIRQIEKEGLKVPPKSACFMCAATQPEELLEWLPKHPEYVQRIKAIEEAGDKSVLKLKGLWGSNPKKGEPARWIEFMKKYGFLKK